MKRSNKSTPTPAQRAALDHGFTLGRSHGIRWAAAELDSTVEPTEADYVALETERDAAEAKHASWRGWFAEAYDEGFKSGAATVQHLRGIAGGAA